MRNYIIAFCIAASLFSGYSLFVNLTTPAFAGDESLSQTTIPAAADIVKFYDASTGTLVGINWTYMSRQMLQGVNWVGLNTTTGAINWNYIGQ